MKTVGIGSLPHLSIEDACNYSLKHDMPFLPQMTSLGESMIEQALSRQPLFHTYSALKTFTEKLLLNNIEQFKIQIAGPETCKVHHKIIYSQLI